MALSVGSVTVNSATDITGDGMAKSLFDARKAVVDVQLDAADAAAASQPRQPDPAKVQEFIRADLATNGPLVAGYATANSWPESLLAPLPEPIDRATVYRGLADECEALAAGIIPYLVANTEVVGGGIQ